MPQNEEMRRHEGFERTFDMLHIEGMLNDSLEYVGVGIESL